MLGRGLESPGRHPLLFWRAIERAKAGGANEFDLGRPDLKNQGLITFKDRWASRRTELTYRRFPGRPCVTSGNGRARKIAGFTVGFMPDPLLTLARKLIYPHVG